MEDEKYMTIDQHKIHYKIAGSGPTTLLLIHSAVGSTNDFTLQMSDKFDLNHNDFTIVAYDMPGLGKSSCLAEKRINKNGEVEGFSTLPTREYFELAASMGAKLMSKLGYKTYFVGGWSDGARVASLLAIRHQSRVNGLFLWAFVPVMDEYSCKAIGRTRDTETWNESVLENYTSVYGESRFSELWKEYVDFIISTLEMADQFDIRSELSSIKCPTMVIYGDQDPIVSFRRHVKPLDMQIYNSEIVKFGGCAHNIHQANPNEFNSLLKRFVVSSAY